MRASVIARQVGATLFVCSLLALVPTASARDQLGSGNPVGVLRAWERALNAHDASTAMALMADGAAVQTERGDQQPEQIRGWIEQLIREGVRLDMIGEPRIDSGPSVRYAAATIVTSRARLTLDRFRARGLRTVEATLRATVVDSRIVFLSLRPDANWFERSLPLV